MGLRFNLRFFLSSREPAEIELRHSKPAVGGRPEAGPQGPEGREHPVCRHLNKTCRRDFHSEKKSKRFRRKKRDCEGDGETQDSEKKIYFILLDIKSSVAKEFFRPKSFFVRSFPKRSFCNCSLNCCCCSNAYKVFQLVVDKFLSTLTISLLILFKARTLTKQQSKILKQVCKKAPREKS